MNTKTHVSLAATDVYRRSGLSIWSLQFAMLILSLLGALGLLGFSFVQKNQAYSSFGPAAVPGWGQGTLILSIVLFLLVILLLLNFTLPRKFGMSINKEGLTFYRPLFTDVFIPWISVKGIAFAQDQFKLASNQRGSLAILWLEDEERVALRRYIHSRDLPDAVTRIKAELYPQLEIRLRNLLQAGKDASFGSITMNKNGINFNSHPLSWKQIDQIRVKDGYLELILANQKTLRQAIINIPNLEVLILLVREFEKR
jgi:hypothetical protein